MFRYEYFQPAQPDFPMPFLRNDELVKWVNERHYTKVHEGTVMEAAQEPVAALNALYHIHNMDDRPRRFEIPSMSVGHVVMLHEVESGQRMMYVCASEGWVCMSPRDLEVVK